MVRIGDKIFTVKAFRWLENAILIMIFANTVNASFNYTFVQLIYTQFRSPQLFKNYLILTIY